MKLTKSIVNCTARNRTNQKFDYFGELRVIQGKTKTARATRCASTRGIAPFEGDGAIREEALRQNPVWDIREFGSDINWRIMRQYFALN
jgi:hypothetical protein